MSWIKKIVWMNVFYGTLILIALVLLGMSWFISSEETKIPNTSYALTAYATVLLSFFTVLLWRSTMASIAVNKEIYRKSTTPSVIVYVEFDLVSQIYSLVLANTSQSAAYNVTVTYEIDREVRSFLHQSGETTQKRLSDLYPKVSVLPPKYKMHRHLHKLSEVHETPFFSDVATISFEARHDGVTEYHETKLNVDTETTKQWWYGDKTDPRAVAVEIAGYLRVMKEKEERRQFLEETDRNLAISSRLASPAQPISKFRGNREFKKVRSRT